MDTCTLAYIPTLPVGCTFQKRQGSAPGSAQALQLMAATFTPACRSERSTCEP